MEPPTDNNNQSKTPNGGQPGTTSLEPSAAAAVVQVADTEKSAKAVHPPSNNATDGDGRPGCDGGGGAHGSGDGHQPTNHEQNNGVVVQVPSVLVRPAHDSSGGATAKTLTETTGGGVLDSVDQPSDVDESQADELVVKEECTFPQDEYMDDEELQLVDQHIGDSPTNGTSAAQHHKQQQHSNVEETMEVAEDSQSTQPQNSAEPLGGAKTTHENGGQNLEESSAKAVEEDPSKHIQTPEQMKRLLLTQGQLKRLQLLDIEDFRQAVIGFYVRVNYAGLPSKFATTIFIDQIGDVLEAESFQHLWLKRRLRLRRLGDYSIDRILPTQHVKNDQDIVSWFSYIEAKDEQSPTLGFVHQKEGDLVQAFKAIELADAVKKEEKVFSSIKKENLLQIALSPSMLRLLAKLDFEPFRAAVTGCFVFMSCISKDKPSECQFHIIEVKDVVHGPREYKIYKKGEVQAKIDYQLVFPLYGKYAINWIHTFNKLNDEGFKLWLSDMRQWKEALPSIERVREKAAQLQMAISDAEQVPDLEEQERARQREEERAKRAKLPAQNAKDLDACTLSRPQLLKLATLGDRAQFAQAITGCFIRLNAGAANHFEIDQIVKVDHPPVPADDASSTTSANKKTDKVVLELKVTGTISLTALTYIASNFKFTEDEFRKSWLAETTEANPLPTMEKVQQKHKELEEAFRAVSAAAEAQQQKTLSGDNKGSTAGGTEANDNDKSGGAAGEEKQTTTSGNNRGGAAADAVDDHPPDASSAEASAVHAQSEPGSKGPVATNADGNRTSAPSVQVRDGQLTMVDMRKVLISMSKLLELMTMDKESLIRALRGFYARVATKRQHKPQALQFYIDQITGVSWGGEPYRFRGKARRKKMVMTDIRLHFRHMGERTLYQLHRTDGVHLTNESFQMFIEDMKKWKHQLPTLSFIDKKVRELSQAQRRSRSSLSSSGGGAAFGSSPPQPLGAPSRRSLGEFRSHQQHVLPGFEQIHNVIQRQVASSVLSTPGLGGMSSGGGGGRVGVVAPFQSQHHQQQFQWQQQQQQHQQQQPFMSRSSSSVGGGGSSAGGVVGPSLMSMPSPFVHQPQLHHQQQQQHQHQSPPMVMGKESWRGSQRQLMDVDVPQPIKYVGGGATAYQRGDRDLGGGGYDMRRVSGGTGYDDYGSAGGSSTLYSSGGGGGGRLDGHGGAMLSQQQHQQPLPLGSSLAAVAGHYNASYGAAAAGGGGSSSSGPTPPKRHRYASPQPPPVERFF